MRWRYRIGVAAVFILMLLLIPGNSIPSNNYFGWQVARITEGEQLELGRWEVESLSRKVWELAFPPHRGLTPAEQNLLVRAYVQDAYRIGQLEEQLAAILGRTTGDAEQSAQAAPLQAELARLRQAQAERRPAAEAIVQDQVAAVLADEGLTALDFVQFPPVRFGFTEPPLYLIISPRDRIYVQYGLHLEPDMDVAQQEIIEEEIAARFNVSALIEGTGGLGAYPAMVLDEAGLPWILSTVAHEWVHNYLVFYRLGFNYFGSQDLTTMNETVADIVGEEIGARVLARFYPDLVPPPPTPTPLPPPADAAAEPPFSFRAFMRATRVQLDEMLAAGQIEQAEAYMEARRQELVARGYPIRKLNQAYFAFHGSYATGPSSIDPIGPKLMQLREASPSLRDYVVTVRGFLSVADLDAALAARGLQP